MFVESVCVSRCSAQWVSSPSKAGRIESSHRTLPNYVNASCAAYYVCLPGCLYMCFGQRDHGQLRRHVSYQVSLVDTLLYSTTLLCVIYYVHLIVGRHFPFYGLFLLFSWPFHVCLLYITYCEFSLDFSFMAHVNDDALC